ncbi:hypothetical protein TNCV_3204501 [Trichonephila clavipes]|nr:hypothetical protein TNCV_3204501 [Trichonephila clavipes]
MLSDCLAQHSQIYFLPKRKKSTHSSSLDHRSKIGAPPPIICSIILLCRPSGIVKLNAVPLDLGSNLGEDMDVCKCIVPSRHGSSREVGGRGRNVRGSRPPPGCSPSKLG